MTKKIVTIAMRHVVIHLVKIIHIHIVALKVEIVEWGLSQNLAFVIIVIYVHVLSHIILLLLHLHDLLLQNKWIHLQTSNF